MSRLREQLRECYAPQGPVPEQICQELARTFVEIGESKTGSIEWQRLWQTALDLAARLEESRPRPQHEQGVTEVRRIVVRPEDLLDRVDRLKKALAQLVTTPEAQAAFESYPRNQTPVAPSTETEEPKSEPATPAPDRCQFCGSTLANCAKWKEEHPTRWHTYSLKQAYATGEGMVTPDAPFVPKQYPEDPQAEWLEVPAARSEGSTSINKNQRCNTSEGDNDDRGPGDANPACL